MTFAAQTILKPTSVATHGCLISSPSLFTASHISCSHPYLSIPYKPIKFQLSCQPLLSLKRKEPLCKVSVVAAQEGNNPVILKEKEEDEQEFLGNLNWDASENDEKQVEGEESDGAVDAEGGGFVEPPDGAKVYVGNLPYDVDSEQLALLFQQAGVVEIAEVIYNGATDQSRGFGFVTMSTKEEAEKAVEMFHRYDLSGRLLTVNMAAPRGSRPERASQVFQPIYRIYVGNLPWNVDSTRLEQIFSEHGKVVSARVVFDRETGRSRGFGFVVMSSESEMNDAIANIDGQSLDGRAIRVNVAEERPRRGGF